MSPMIAVDYCRQSSQVTFQGREPTQGSALSLRRGDTAWECPGRPRQLKFVGQMERRWHIKLQRSADSSPQVFRQMLINVCLSRSYPRLGKETPENIKWHILFQAHTGLGAVPISTKQNGETSKSTWQ